MEQFWTATHNADHAGMVPIDARRGFANSGYYEGGLGRGGYGGEAR